MILHLENVEASYGLSQILFDVNLDVDENKVVCLLGRNGVGKSTTIKTIMGILKPKSGTIKFMNKEIGGKEPYYINKYGIAYVPQGRHVFPTLTVKENIIFGERIPKGTNNPWTLERIYEIFPRMKERENFMGNRISGGEQQMMVIARALMQNPKLLLLDEICEGLAPIVVKELGEVIMKLSRQGVAILLVEQSAKFALEISDYCYIMEKGTIVYKDNTKSISEETFRKYMGT
jgi:branched-chain amino acid transport system ATP-binding protein